jgi:hypothetical protein
MWQLTSWSLFPAKLTKNGRRFPVNLRNLTDRNACRRPVAVAYFCLVAAAALKKQVARYSDTSSPPRGGFPPRRFMILSKALKSALAFRSTKKWAVWSAETFSATAVATNWLILVRSSLLRRTTASLSDRGSRKGYVRVSFIESFLSLPWGEGLRARIAPELAQSPAD